MTGQALLRGILESPADTAARLIFADWLEEQGTDDARAELIRLQCVPPRKARHREPYIRGCSCPACSPRNRVRDLIGLHGIRWLGAAVDVREGHPPWKCLETSLAAGADHFFRYERGFLVYARVPWPFWRRYGPALCRLHPLTRVVLAHKRPARCPGLEGRRYWATSPPGGEGGVYPAYEVAPCLWQFLAGDNNYPTHAAAREALGQAALAWAKAESAGGGP